MQHLHAATSPALQQFHGQVANMAGAHAAKAETAGLYLRSRQDAGNIPFCKRAARYKNKRHIRQENDGREGAPRIIGQVAIKLMRQRT